MNNPLNDAVGATGRVRQAIMVWDMPVRVFHWLLVICFTGAWISSEGERWALIHYAFGYSSPPRSSDFRFYHLIARIKQRGQAAILNKGSLSACKKLSIKYERYLNTESFGKYPAGNV
jgi:hypothetical protein